MWTHMKNAQICAGLDIHQKCEEEPRGGEELDRHQCRRRPGQPSKGTLQHVAEVEDFVEFLASKARKRSALDRLLTIAPPLETAGGAPISEEEIAAEVDGARAERRARLAAKG